MHTKNTCPTAHLQAAEVENTAHSSQPSLSLLRAPQYRKYKTIPKTLAKIQKYKKENEEIQDRTYNIEIQYVQKIQKYHTKNYK